MKNYDELARNRNGEWIFRLLTDLKGGEEAEVWSPVRLNHGCRSPRRARTAMVSSGGEEVKVATVVRARA